MHLDVAGRQYFVLFDFFLVLILFSAFIWQYYFVWPNVSGHIFASDYFCISVLLPACQDGTRSVDNVEEDAGDTTDCEWNRVHTKRCALSTNRK